MNAIDEIINIESLIIVFGAVVKSGQLRSVMDEIIMQSRVEFNYNDEHENIE